MQDYNLKIIEIIDETPDVKTFRVEVPEKIGFFPGQFFMVSFEGNPNLKRAYSIASSPEQNNHLDITMNLVGEFTKKLWQCKINDSLIFKGPFGKFYFTEEMKNNLILIGGGLGITPLMSVMRYCNDKKLQNKINLLYSVRTPSDIIYNEEIERIKNENSNLRCTITVTRPKPEHNWHGQTGRVNEELLKQNIADIKNSLYFICGPLEFVKGAIELLEKLGAAKEQIKTDVWG
jgi:glycine betaine catabolism B